MFAPFPVAGDWFETLELLGAHMRTSSGLRGYVEALLVQRIPFRLAPSLGLPPFWYFSRKIAPGDIAAGGRRGRRLRPNAGYCQRRDTCGNDNHDCYGFYILPVSYRVAGQSLERALYYAAVYSQSGAGYRRRQWAGDVRHQGSDFVGRGEALD